jgi:hypothetical protein
MEKIVRSNSKVDAGTACTDSANKVEPCPNVRIVQPMANGVIGENKFLIIGEIQEDAVFITRIAPPFGGSNGGGIEIVCSPNSVKMESFHILNIE